MKGLVLIAGAMLALSATGCASHDRDYIPMPRNVMAKAECTHTRRMAGSRCHVVTSEAEKRRILRSLQIR